MRETGPELKATTHGRQGRINKADLERMDKEEDEKKQECSLEIQGKRDFGLREWLTNQRLLTTSIRQRWKLTAGFSPMKALGAGMFCLRDGVRT